ncbi:hypothetical protein GCM10025884_20130 [Leuconostoc gelidum subsp. gelidum]|nr:hypothetical protein GCM10025884_20130 [Leuconostoc gelidum subsp. gelidum]
MFYEIAPDEIACFSLAFTDYMGNKRGVHSDSFQNGNSHGANILNGCFFIKDFVI